MKRFAFLLVGAALGCGSGESKPNGAVDSTLAFIPSAASASSDGSKAVLSAAPGAPAVAGLTAEEAKAFEQADVIVGGKIVAAKIDAVLEVSPPIYVHVIELEVDRRFAGAKTPERIVTKYSTRDVPEPFAVGKRAILALQHVEANLVEPENHFEANAVVYAHPDIETSLEKRRVAIPDQLALHIEQVPAARVYKWQNEYGDGVFKLTLTNQGAQPIEVDGLYEDDGLVRWENALLVREQGRNLMLKSSPLSAKARPLVLAAGASVETTVDVKPLGLVNPAGGYRVYYSFGLGDLRTSSFFYYSHELHGPMMPAPIRTVP